TAPLRKGAAGCKVASEGLDKSRDLLLFGPWTRSVLEALWFDGLFSRLRHGQAGRMLLLGRLLGRPVAAAIIEVDGGLDVYVLLRRCLVVAFSSPWVEIIGIALGISTGWYFRRRDVITERETQQQQQQLVV
ncbi:unnamed protein product, partial [Ectocarpus sp. 4 AP-2014]